VEAIQLDRTVAVTANEVVEVAARAGMIAKPDARMPHANARGANLIEVACQVTCIKCLR
jgi:hypothetical protein